jgi:hypothetical protein
VGSDLIRSRIIFRGSPRTRRSQAYKRNQLLYIMRLCGHDTGLYTCSWLQMSRFKLIRNSCLPQGLLCFHPLRVQWTGHPLKLLFKSKSSEFEGNKRAESFRPDSETDSSITLRQTHLPLSQVCLHEGVAITDKINLCILCYIPG